MKIPGEAILQVTVPGEPVAKERPRLGRGRVYTPAKTATEEERIGWFVRQAIGSKEADEASEFRVWIEFFRAAKKRRDLDNLAKLVLDACNGIIWKDDSQVTVLSLVSHSVAADPMTILQVWVR